jgi:uncharacterized protein
MCSCSYKMKTNKTYKVELNRLLVGDNIFNYSIDSTFFEQFEFGEIQSGDFEVEINIIKSTARLHLNININGYANTACDKCTADIELKLNNNFSYTIRTVPKNELTDNVLSDAEFITVSQDEQELDVSIIIYENIHLLLPMQRIGCQDRNGIKRCDETVLNKIEQSKVEITEEETSIDPRWAALLKLKNNNN